MADLAPHLSFSTQLGPSSSSSPSSSFPSSFSSFLVGRLGRKGVTGLAVVRSCDGKSEFVHHRSRISRQNEKRFKSLLQKNPRSGPATKKGAPHVGLALEEEQQFVHDLQDLLFLENKQKQLSEELGRRPTDEEWAKFIGCSIYRLYARLGKGRASRRKMIQANMPLVASVAKGFCGCGLSYQELCQEGAMGLFKSTEKFNPKFNTKFSTYSFFWIRERIIAALKKFGHTLAIGKPIYQTLSLMQRYKNDFEAIYGKRPTINELVASSNLNKSKVITALSAIRSPKRLHTNLSSQHNRIEDEVLDSWSASYPWAVLMEEELKVVLTQMFANLSPRELQVIHSRYGLSGGNPQTLVQVAAKLGVEYETVRIAEKNAIRKLRGLSKDYELEHYLSKRYSIIKEEESALESLVGI